MTLLAETCFHRTGLFESPIALKVRSCWPPGAAVPDFPGGGGKIRLSPSSGLVAEQGTPHLTDRSCGSNTSREEDWRLSASLQILSLDLELQSGLVWLEALSENYRCDFADWGENTVEKTCDHQAAATNISLF